MHHMRKPRQSVSITDIQTEYLKRQAESFGISISEYLRRIIDRDREANDPEVLSALKRWEQYARDNRYTDEDCTFLPATRAAIARAGGSKA